MQKYAGLAGTLAYAAMAGVAIAVAPSLPARLSERKMFWLALGTFVVVASVFLAVYPIVNTHQPGRGSDDDDAYNLGAIALLTGHSPYTQVTYLGNALHQFPGAFILAAPFVLLGTSALQNLFWLPVFFLAVRKETGDSRTTLRMAWLVLGLSPAVMHQVVTGTGHLSNTIYVLLGLWCLVRTQKRDVAAVAWGVTLASRANFLLLVPLAFGWFRQHHGFRAAWRATLLACLTCATLTLPFYVNNPTRFGPFEAADRLLRFDAFLPHLGVALIALMTCLSVGLSFTSMDTAALFRNCALVQAFPVAMGLVLGSVQERRLDLLYAPYGTFFVWFALMALAIRPATAEDV